MLVSGLLLYLLNFNHLSIGLNKRHFNFLNSTAPELPKLYTNYSKYVVSLQQVANQPEAERHYFGSKHFCTGTLITPKYILTSSHCVFDSSRRVLKSSEDIIIIAGTPNCLRRNANTQIYHVDEIVPYRRFRVRERHDIALLRLRESIDLNITRSLAFAQLADSLPAPQTNCTMLGWGQKHLYASFSENLSELEFSMQSVEFCKSIYPVTFALTMICALPLPSTQRNACAGDSGGPLFCDNKLVGLVSRGMNCDKKYPIIFTSVLYHRNWINDNSRAPMSVGYYELVFGLFALMCSIIK